MRRAHKVVVVLAILLPAPAAGDIAYITCQNGEELSLIDLASAREIDRWHLPGKPAGIAAGGDALFTVSPGSKMVRRLSRGGGVFAEVTLEGGPTGVALDAARGRLFVSDWYNARLWVLDSDTLATVMELPTGPSPAGIALSEDGRFLASAEKDADQVSVFDAASLEPLRRITVGTRPFGLRFAPTGLLFVGNVGSNDVSVLDVATGKTRATIPVGERPYGVAFAGARAFVTDQYANTVSVIDLETLTRETTIDVGEYPEGIDVTPDGQSVVVANWFDNTVSVIDPNGLTVLNTIETCDGPRAFGRFVLGGGHQ
ncbi:YncE family protein [Ruegeria sp. 2205SS24-7]|uniref:YncE family protein n=1 Tax=Ruegeria discodermiae TaxID=3064389 RepID=UPI0027418BBC|nr:YncE family protein [Ruegeria sp. 2205SS24-7]MDP5217037.1 YncE family protein [Ruegeria sp. 2205SS24-7]